MSVQGIVVLAVTCAFHRNMHAFFQGFLHLCVGNRKENSFNSNLMSSLKICLRQKTDSDNQITADRILEAEFTRGILSNPFGFFH